MRDNLFHFLYTLIAIFCIVSGANVPTRPPTQVPTKIPTKMPTIRPTNAPTIKPTRGPTLVPTRIPTRIPTKRPSPLPTSRPTARPTSHPTSRPSRPTSHPNTNYPTSRPTARPSPHVPHNFYPSPQPSNNYNSYQPTNSYNITVNSVSGGKNYALSTEYVIIISLICAIFALIVAFISYVIYTRQSGVANNYKTTVATTVEPAFDVTTFSVIEPAVVAADIYDDDEEKRYGSSGGNVEMRPLSVIESEDLRHRISNI